MIAAWAGLVLGLAGSGHCAGMCGPLVLLANPRDSADGQADQRGLTRHVALYHAGRVGIYAVLPSNRHIPHRVRVLMDFLGERLAG